MLTFFISFHFFHSSLKSFRSFKKNASLDREGFLEIKKKLNEIYQQEREKEKKLLKFVIVAIDDERENRKKKSNNQHLLQYFFFSLWNETNRKVERKNFLLCIFHFILTLCRMRNEMQNQYLIEKIELYLKHENTLFFRLL